MSEEKLMAWLYHAMKAVARNAAKRTRHLLKPRQSAAFDLTIKGTVAGEEVGESFRGKMHVCPNGKYQGSPGAEAALAAVHSLISQRIANQLAAGLAEIDWSTIKTDAPESTEWAKGVLNAMRMEQPKKGGVKLLESSG